LYIWDDAMKEVSVSELRRNLQAFLTRVSRGDRLRVTSRGRAVAEIGPPVADVDRAAEARARLRDSVARYDDPTAPTFTSEEWEMNR
jgi:prevent-host-death family protein